MRPEHLIVVQWYGICSKNSSTRVGEQLISPTLITVISFAALCNCSFVLLICNVELIELIELPSENSPIVIRIAAADNDAVIVDSQSADRASNRARL
jgi:hypothetical protein